MHPNRHSTNILDYKPCEVAMVRLRWVIVGENIFSGFIAFSFVEVDFVYVRKSANLSAVRAECGRCYSVFYAIKHRCDFVEKGEITLGDFEGTITFFTG